MSDFDKYFKSKFSDVHEACCCGDLVAINYRKSIKKAWNHQQQKIDEIYELKQKMVERVIELSAENEKLQNRLRRLK